MFYIRNNYYKKAFYLLELINSFPPILSGDLATNYFKIQNMPVALFKKERQHSWNLCSSI